MQDIQILDPGYEVALVSDKCSKLNKIVHGLKLLTKFRSPVELVEPVVTPVELVFIAFISTGLNSDRHFLAIQPVAIQPMSFSG
jgi:hypothetical protein